ncbi:type I restriction-modification system S subunit [Sphaerospermopsis reniformis]|uniref:Type I restriction-modification system S subunit n=1 Tax=Sphaerospermopsis reniformis TaxID=531300 RepID=A0A480A5A2_9CYAN|nr:restriction endonuclease subunit S [Sphaerospermopsis reniformis]GCL40185.1 type I restriction-modification system S subunit [Sphaerospermopsis reniformis]
MGKYQGYDKYKDSGVEWLGDIPNHWEVKRFKFSVYLINNKIEAENSNLTYMGLEHIESWTGKRIEDENASSEGIGSHFLPNDVLFGKLRPYLAKVYLSEIEGLASTEALVLRCKNDIYPKFLKYYILSRDFINIVDSSTFGAKMPRASWDFICNLFFTFPPLDEQEKIARFLDYKTKQIDELIAKKETLIEKLDEKRTSLISHAVTKGLDVNVPMKDSGIEWLGEIPKHWKRTVFKYYFDIQLGKMLQNEPQSTNDDEISYLKAIHVRWDKVDIYDLPKMWASPKDREKYSVKNGDLLICEGGEVGRTALLKGLQEDCIIQNALHRVRPLSQSSVEYLDYLMRHIADTGWFEILCNKSTISHLTSEKLGALALPLPPLHEQQKIAEYLDQKTAQIDEQKTKIQQAIDLLKEYRTALITNAVTGKIDVRKIPIPKI